MHAHRLHGRKNHFRGGARDPVVDVVIVTEECFDISLDEAVSCRIHALTARDKSTGLMVVVHLGIWPSSGTEVLALFGGNARASSTGALGAIRVSQHIPATLVVDDGRGFHDAAFRAAALKMGVTVVHAPGPVGLGPAPSLARWLGVGQHDIGTLRDLRNVVDAWLAHLDHSQRDAGGMARA